MAAPPPSQPSSRYTAARARLDSQELPRFLFRGFSSRSGGGFDPRLNNEDGIIPHAFLNGEAPTSMYNIDYVKDVIDGHTHHRHIRTPFSSWAAQLSVALRYIGGDFGPNSYIAIFDMRQKEPHNEVYFLPELYEAGLASDETLNHEYLVYGPVRGPAYRCAKGSDIVAMGFDAACLKTQAPLTRNDVRMALRIAELFYRPYDPDDIFLGAFAAFVTVVLRPWNLSYCEDRTDEEMQIVFKELRKAARPGSCINWVLCNEETFTDDLLWHLRHTDLHLFPGLRQMIELLSHLEREFCPVSVKCVQKRRHRPLLPRLKSLSEDFVLPEGYYGRGES
ncbi:hypothetical protein F5B20DRAFT_579463 [Whalleya microplaca]|nr:hypothetical protein F5B20DRAFT_579463 [Whalleya microplaca]